MKSYSFGLMIISVLAGSCVGTSHALACVTSCPPPPTVSNPPGLQSGFAPGLYVQVLDGLINVANPGGGGGLYFSAGQFGFTPGFTMPPIILPNNPGLQFNPPPIFNPDSNPNPNPNPNYNSQSNQNQKAYCDGGGGIDCIVRFAPETESDVARQANEIFSPLAYANEAPANLRLGMYASPPDTPGGLVEGWGAQGGGAVTRSSGSRMTDSAGVLAPGTIGPSSRGTTGSGGLFGTFDASKYFGLASQTLLLNGFFNYAHSDTSMGAAPAAAPLVIGNAGSIRSDNYAFGGNVLFRSGATYAIGSAAYSFGHAAETDNVTPATGGFGVHGYSVDGRLGEVFVLMNTARAPSRVALPTKAPPKPAQGTVAALDLSGHLGYFDMRANGFTDSSGFIYGTAQSKAGDVGGRARLFALIPGNNWLWMPYVSGAADQEFGVSNTLNVPSQAALPSGDLVNWSPRRSGAANSASMSAPLSG